MNRVFLWGVSLLFLWCNMAAEASENSPKGWFICTYGGILGDTVLTRVYYDPHLTDSTLMALGVGKKIFENKHYVRLELESQIVRHSGQNKFVCTCPSCDNPGVDWAANQSYEKSRDIRNLVHYEMNGVIVIRWLKFPWERYIDIDFAAGEGISYATQPPPIEVDTHAVNHGDDHHTSRWLNYLMFELTVALPRFASWHTFYRVHHRSGDFGLFNGVSDGSNFICLGIRYDF